MSTTIPSPTSTEAAPNNIGDRRSELIQEIDIRPDEISPLVTEHGTTTISEIVVLKIAGLAAREVPGVHDLGGGAARAIGAIRERIPGQKTSIGQGVNVEVGVRQAAVDIQVVVDYGVAIKDVADSLRSHVIRSIEDITGLHVTEVNIAVNDIHLPNEEDEDDTAADSRVE